VPGIYSQREDGELSFIFQCWSTCCSVGIDASLDTTLFRPIHTSTNWGKMSQRLHPLPSLKMEGFVEEGLAKTIGVSNFTKVQE